MMIVEITGADCAEVGGSLIWMSVELRCHVRHICQGLPDAGRLSRTYGHGDAQRDGAPVDGLMCHADLIFCVPVRLALSSANRYPVRGRRAKSQHSHVVDVLVPSVAIYAFSSSSVTGVHLISFRDLIPIYCHLFSEMEGNGGASGSSSR